MVDFGDVVEHEAIETSIDGAVAFRVAYRSIDVAGRSQLSSGLVVAPVARGDDRPILTWCHGTTGLGDAACPSMQPDPARNLTTYFSETSTAQIDYGIPGLVDWIKDGFVVCATDYQGLGTDGVHQYPVSRTNGLDAIGIVHAARSMDLGASSTVAVAGWSQGGGAAAAVAELDDEVFADLDLVGCVPISPGVLSVSLTSPGGDTAALQDPTVPPSSHLLMTLYGHAAAFDHLDLDEVMTPLGRSVMDAIWNTQPVHHLGDTTARLFRLRGGLLRTNPLADPRWLEAFRAGSAGQSVPRCPVLVCIDGFGGGTVLPVAWQEAYVAAARSLGGNVDVRTYPDDDHFSVCDAAIGDVRSWVNSLIG